MCVCVCVCVWSFGIMNCETTVLRAKCDSFNSFMDDNSVYLDARLRYRPWFSRRARGVIRWWLYLFITVVRVRAVQRWRKERRRWRRRRQTHWYYIIYQAVALNISEGLWLHTHTHTNTHTMGTHTNLHLSMADSEFASSLFIYLEAIDLTGSDGSL